MSKYIFGFIAGHGGMIDGRYATAPHKMAVLPNGQPIYEGVINRQIVHATIEIAKWEGLGDQVINIVDENEDLSLRKRVDRVSRMHQAFKEQGRKLLLFEVHCNASLTHTAEGFESFSSKQNNFSDIMCKIWIEEMAKAFPRARNRGEKDKNFFVIYRAPCFGILNEHFFFDNPKEIENNMNGQALANHALAYVRTMQRINEYV